MEELDPRRPFMNSSGRVSFKARQHTQIKCQEKSKNGSFYKPLQVPIHAMEFLCRSWSPSASNFLDILSPKVMMPYGNHGLKTSEDMIDDGSDVLEDENGKKEAKETCTPNHENKKWVTLKHIKGLVMEKSFINIMRRRKEEKREEARFIAAKIHAALSVAQLAAAIASFSTQWSDINDRACHDRNDVSFVLAGGLGVNINNNDNDMNNMRSVVAQASVLLAAICAESAESAGANRAQVASAVSSGLATRTAFDMITLSATAATCLRGAAILKSRASIRDRRNLANGNKEFVELAAKLHIITPSGKKVKRYVYIYMKQRRLILRLEKKYLRVLSTSDEYTIVHVMGEEEDHEGYYILGIRCNCGDMKLLFEVKEQSFLWMSNISSMLHTYHQS